MLTMKRFNCRGKKKEKKTPMLIATLQIFEFYWRQMIKEAGRRLVSARPQRHHIDFSKWN